MCLVCVFSFCESAPVCALRRILQALPELCVSEENAVRSLVLVWIFVFAAASFCLLAAARELCVEFSALRLASLL